MEREAPLKEEENKESQEEDDMVHIMFEGELYEIPCRVELDSVQKFKLRIEHVLGLETSQFKIEFNGTKLKDDEYLEDIGFDDDTHMQVVAGLFARMANYSRVGFAIDVSGSMRAGVGGSDTQLSVVQSHLIRCLRSLKKENCSFGLATFNNSSTMPLGPQMIGVSQLQQGVTAVQSFRASGGSNGSHKCLRNLINMDPEVIFFLGDGKWLIDYFWGTREGFLHCVIGCLVCFVFSIVRWMGWKQFNTGSKDCSHL